MRIGIDIRSLIEPFPSGISEYTFQTVKKLLQADQDNKYILFYNAKKELPIKYYNDFRKYKAEIKASHWPNKIFNLLLFLKIFVKLDKLIGEVDIFYMPNINFFALSKKAKLILTIHDLSFEYPKYFSLKSNYWHKFIKPKKIIQRADRIITVSENTKQDLMQNYGVDDNKIKVIYSGVELDNFRNLFEEKKQEIKVKHNIKGEFFLYLGNLENRKNVNTIIIAWEEFNKSKDATIKLVIVGKNINKTSVKHNPGIIFTGYIDDEEKPYFYSMAKAFIYPSFYEGFGLPVIEAMAAGCPVITSFSTSLPEISNQAAIFIDPYNIEECVKAMDLINTDTHLRNNLITKGYELVQKYNWQKTVEEMIKLFNLI